MRFQIALRECENRSIDCFGNDLRSFRRSTTNCNPRSLDDNSAESHTLKSFKLSFETFPPMGQRAVQILQALPLDTDSIFKANDRIIARLKGSPLSLDDERM